MDYFSNKQPNLIGNKVHKTVYHILQAPTADPTLSDKISGFFTSFYRDYISNNKFTFLFIIIIMTFLLYRYMNRSKQRKKKIYTPEEETLHRINDLLNENSWSDSDRIYHYDQL